MNWWTLSYTRFTRRYEFRWIAPIICSGWRHVSIEEIPSFYSILLDHILGNYLFLRFDRIHIGAPRYGNYGATAVSSWNNNWWCPVHVKICVRCTNSSVCNEPNEIGRKDTLFFFQRFAKNILGIKWCGNTLEICENGSLLFHASYNM